MKFSPKQREALERVADGSFYPCLVREEDGWYARWRSVGVSGENDWVDEYVREFTVTRLTEDAEDQRHETLHDAWLMALRSRTGRVVWDEAECVAFARELETWSGNAAEDREARGSIRLSLSATAGAAEAARPDFILSCPVPRGRRRLKALGQAVYVWSPLCGLKRSADGSRLEVSLCRTEVEDLLHHAARELRDAGYVVEGVDLAAPVTATAEIDASVCTPSAPLPPSACKLTVRVAGKPVTAAEIRFLLEQGSTVVFFRDRWIEVDRGILKEALRALEKGSGRKVNPISLALGLGHVGRLEFDEIKAHGWLRGLVNELRSKTGKLQIGCGTEASPVSDTPTGFTGILRPYQRRGVEWLGFLTDHGFGALLADDMGLGKTIQVIAWILVQRENSDLRPLLVVAPLTLLSNWRHEFAKFAPSLEVYVHQGDRRHVASGFGRAVARADVTVTSYNLLVRDFPEFSGVAWRTLVLDEAQTIKNPDTQVARAVRALTPVRRIAMTGTPIENSVADLWSLEEFLNPGFLGERKSFVERFVRPILADTQSAAAGRLRRALEPFVLRRLKSDKSIAAELGAKREIREYCELAPEQRRDYEAALADFRSGEHVRGDVFALITRLKLICDGAGKLERLCELAEAIFESGESALVFTQYAKVGLWLQTELARRFARRFPFLHGALSATAREEAIREFRETRRPTLFILSLKAGGYGLNLTKATHVIHFDRWWNPAVENQATDRVHRIGQRQTVFVHLFVTAGTLEEHVDEILTKKARTADAVITEAEWLEAVKLDE